MAIVSAELDEDTKRKAEAVLKPMGVSSAFSDDVCPDCRRRDVAV